VATPLQARDAATAKSACCGLGSEDDGAGRRRTALRTRAVKIARELPSEKLMVHSDDPEGCFLLAQPQQLTRGNGPV
jgi:hypothetical protein